MGAANEELEDICWQLLQLSVEEDRLAFLRELDAHAPEKAAAVRELLACEKETRRLFEKFGDRDATNVIVNRDASGGGEVPDASPAFEGAWLKAGAHIGPFRLLEPIGEGGMGVVYLAQQSEPVRRKVALKIIKPGMDSRHVVARFEAERQALAMMEHPNIAKVLDAGTTESGLPYFVMELVRGIPITEYCDLAKMSLEDRLKLFCIACSAIQHAHNKGIIHRDIKPSNVLVTEQDGSPVVKIIDFGVAKALTTDLTDKTLYTGMFQIIGTPLFMSPEQASLSNLDIDTRSDVYSLGVLLYELLVGTPPIDRDSIKEMGVDQLRRFICETELPRPSKKLSTLKDQQATIAERRGISSKELVTHVHKELDWIVMRAIEKDRQRRYQSPRRLAEDVERYLRGEAVEACPPSWLYQATKFSKRHRTFLVSSAIVILALSTATIISTYQAFKAHDASQAASRNLEFAEQKTRELSELLYSEDMISASHHFLAGDHDTVDRILQRHAVAEEAFLRGFEWHFIKGLQPVPAEVLFEAHDRINDVVVTPDGNHVFLGDADGNIMCVDTISGQSVADIRTNQAVVYDLDLTSAGILAAVGETGKVSLFQWNSEDRTCSHLHDIVLGKAALLAVASRSDGAAIWAASTDGRLFEINPTTGGGQEVFRFPTPSPIRDLKVSPSNRLLVAQQKRLHELRVENLAADGKVSSQWNVSPNQDMLDIRDLSMTEDGKFVVIGQLLGLVTLLNRVDVPPTLNFSHLMPSDVHSVAITPSGNWLAAGDATGYIHLLPTEIDERESFLDSSTSRDRRMKSWKAHDGKIEKLRFVSDDKYEDDIALYSAGRDHRLVVSKPFSSLPDAFHSCENLPDTFATIGARCNLLWAHRAFGASFPNPQRGNSEILQSAKNIQFCDVPKTDQIGLLLDGRVLMLADKDLENLSPRDTVWKATPDSFAIRCAVSRDASKFALCIQLADPRRHRIELYEAGRPTPVRVIRSNTANDLTYCPSGERFAYVLNNDIMILDGSTGEPLHRLCQHTDSIQDLDFSPDGKQLASVSSDRQLAVWDIESGELLWSRRAHENRSLAVAFHPDLPTIATVGADAVVRFWSSRASVSHDSVRLVGEFPLDVGACRAMAFSADGRSLCIKHSQRGVTELRATTD